MTLVLRGGRVIDPASETDQVADVVVDGGRILAVAPGAGDRPEHAGAEVVDVTGCLVTPGLIDLHVHVVPGLGDFCVEPDSVGVDSGVPTVCDGGTSGVATFDVSRRIWDSPSTRTEVFAFLDPCQLYLATKDFICHKLEIANDERNLDLESTAASIERNRDVLVGLKVRACSTKDSGPDRSPFLEGAKQVAGDLPIMIHLGRFPFTPTIPVPALLQAMRPGDIITHAFRGAGGLLDRQGKMIPEFRDALDRGVRLDVGHSGTDFRFREARKLFDQGVLPDTISTDLNVFNVGAPVISLAETMSKILAMGVELRDVIAMTTRNTARVIGKLDTHGSLEPGRSAEVSVLRLTDQATELSDGYESMSVDRKLVPVGCLRAGAWFPATGPAAAA